MIENKRSKTKTRIQNIEFQKNEVFKIDDQNIDFNNIENQKIESQNIEINKIEFRRSKPKDRNLKINNDQKSRARESFDHC